MGREKEKGNFEANWGGKSGEGLSVQFTPDGRFTEQVAAISPGKLPAHISIYIRQHYSGTKINGAGKITDAKGAVMYEAEVKGKDLIFDEKGNFLKIGYCPFKLISYPSASPGPIIRMLLLCHKFWPLVVLFLSEHKIYRHKRSISVLF